MLDAVTVTATRSESKVFEVPATVSIFDQKDMERRNVESMRDLIRLEPGIEVGNQPGRFGQTGYTIRGLGDNRVLMMIDGTILPDMPGSFAGGPALYSRDFVDFETLKRVEIVRGPASALYGSDAMGGVVAYVTKDARDFLDLVGKDWYVGVKGAYESVDGGFSETLTTAGRFGLAEALIVATRRDGDEVKPRGDVLTNGAGWNPQDNEQNSFLGKLDLNVTASDRLRFTGEFLHRRTRTDVLSDLVFAPSGFNSRYVDSRADDTTERFRVAAEYTRSAPFFFVDSVLARAYVTRVTRDEQKEAMRIPFGSNQIRFQDSDFAYRQLIDGMEVQFTTAHETGPLAHNWTYGAEATYTATRRPRDRYEVTLATGAVTGNVLGEQFPNKSFPDSAVLKTGAYVQDEMKWNGLTVTPAVRFDWFSLYPQVDQAFLNTNLNRQQVTEVDSFSITPKVGATYKVHDSHLVYASYAHGFRNPTYDDTNTAYRNNVQFYEILPNFGVQPESSDTFEGGLRGRYSDGSSFSIGAFYNLFRNYIEFQQVGVTPQGLLQFQSRNIESVHIYGIEGKGEWRFLQEFGLFGSAAFARGINYDTNRPLDSVAPLTFVAGLRYDNADGWGAQLAGKKAFAHDRVSDPTYFRAPGYAIADVTGYYEVLPDFTFNAGVQNILDHKYWVSRDVVGVANTSTTVDRFSQPGRTFFVNATFRW
ncbi:MAG: TonB-dependent hemoglobin/transferrin/lactoferrin family receptor [Alphaproteobacteria bacterium]|nr:TonB-dependent hemoglobin/transferrin/lactoferrin family receptor [Alphaproteobacteria bacterium]